MSKVEVNQVTQQCGTTLTVGGGACKTAVVDATTVTLGRCGGTVSLASGATQSGFGREGSVDWVTTPQTGTVTAATGKGYFVNTTSGTITVNLPAGVAGSIVAVADYTRTFATYNCTVAPNGSEKIGGVDNFARLNVDGQSATFVYVDGTEGWINVQETQTSQIGVSPFVIATGGTPCTGAICGDFKTHVFTGPGTLCVSNAGLAPGSNTVDYLVVAGGGGGGSRAHSAGGGAGGFRNSNAAGCIPAPSTTPLANPTNIPVSVQGYPITVGGGGAGGAAGGSNNIGTKGDDSIFATITSTGGGYAATYCTAGGPGGSGGGAGGSPTPETVGAGNDPATPISQGYPGGATSTAPPCGQGGGGGGAGAAGCAAGTATPSGKGGVGSYIADAVVGPTAPTYGTPGPVGSTRYFAGGGPGSNTPCQHHPAPPGGGGGTTTFGSRDGTVNTGGGGAAGPCSPAPSIGGTGGSGIVIIRYKFQ